MRHLAMGMRGRAGALLLGLLVALGAAGCTTWGEAAEPVATNIAQVYASLAADDGTIDETERAARIGHAEAFAGYAASNDRAQALALWGEPPALLRQRFVAYLRGHPRYDSDDGREVARQHEHSVRLMNEMFDLPIDEGLGP